jgi:hypothetical protein
MVEKTIESRIEEEDNDDIDAILSKAVVIQRLYAVYDDEINWDIVVVVDDLVGLGKTVIYLPKACLNKEELRKYIEEVKKKKV